MNTQTQIASKGQLLLVVAGIFLIPLYAVYFNETPEEKLANLKKQKNTSITKKMVKPVLQKTALTPQPKPTNTEKMSFSEAFKYYHKYHGEGYVFTWHGYEYRVDVFELVIPASKYDALDFGDAFKLARTELGNSNQFEWRGALYSTGLVGETKNTVQVKQNTAPEIEKSDNREVTSAAKRNETPKHFLYGLNNADHYHRDFSGMSACYVSAELCRHEMK